MKWFALIIILAAVVPFAAWLRRNPHQAPKAWMLVGFLPFVLHYFHLYLAVISYSDWPGYVIGVAPPPEYGVGWPGYVEGAEVSALDLLALALYLGFPSAGRSPPFRLPMALYFCAVLLSAYQAAEPKTALFYCWQLTRMFLVYSVVARTYYDPRVAPAILKGMAAGLLLQVPVAIWQLLGLHIDRPLGTFTSANLLGLMVEFAIFPFFALLLAGRGGWLGVAVLLAGCLVTALTESRAAIALAGLGLGAILTLSVVSQPTSKKALALLVGATGLIALSPFALLSIEQRSDVSSFFSDFERPLLNAEATAIVSDHPMGVGANQYVVVANEGYRQQVSQARQQMGMGSTVYYVIVHNVYLLVAAETGYLGLITFVLLLVRPLFVAFRCGWQNRGDPQGHLMLGLGVGLLIVYTHCYFEWAFLLFEPQYIFALELALVANLAQQLGYWKSPYRKDFHFRAPIRSTRSKLAKDAH